MNEPEYKIDLEKHFAILLTKSLHRANFLFSRTAVTSAHIPEEDTYYRTSNMCPGIDAFRSVYHLACS